MIVDSHGHVCHIEKLCNCRGDWMRVDYLNMTNSSEKCPDGFRLYSQNGFGVCCSRPAS